MMWVLDHAKDVSEARELLTKNIANEIPNRTAYEVW